MFDIEKYPYLKKLNKEQLSAATIIDGRLLILAGAGSGKTATLISRVAYMIDNGVAPENILLLTFTNKAAKEMRDRATLMVGEYAQKITACTFHSFCANFMRQYAKLVGLPNNFTIIDSADTKDVMDLSRQEFLEKQEKDGIEYDLKAFPKTTALLTMHEAAINTCMSLSKIIELYQSISFRHEIMEINKIFNSYKQQRALVDYNDLLYYTVSILQNNESIREYFDEKYKYICCDEYQDTNTIQNMFLDLLTKDYKNLAVVGDDNQSIYGWRSADIRNILDFDNKYPDCKKVTLFENYRSSQEILDFANAVMLNATEGIRKDLHGQFSFEIPHFVEVRNNFEESEFIRKEIEKLHANGLPYNEMAIMIRSSRLSNIVESELMSHGIPFKKFGGIKFLEKATVKDILAFLRVMVNDKDELAWFRITQLFPGIGKKFAKNIASHLSENGLDGLTSIYKKRAFATYLEELHTRLSKHQFDSLSNFLTYIIDDYYPYIANEQIDKTKNKTHTEKEEMRLILKGELEDAKILFLLAEKYSSATDFLADIVLDATAEEEVDDYVNITTVHSAKGLEYDTVFFMDVIQGVTPSCSESDDEAAEELRVFYVGITRAKRRLYLLCPKRFQLGPAINNAECTFFMMHQNVFETLDRPMPEYADFNWQFNFSYLD